jgi:hypothetical protein
MSLIYINFASHQNMWTNQPKAAKSLMSQLSSKWLECTGTGLTNEYLREIVDPPYVESLSNYISERHTKKTGSNTAKPTSSKETNTISDVFSKRASSPPSRVRSPKLRNYESSPNRQQPEQ